MKRLLIAAAAIAALAASSTVASANPHPEWHKGARMGQDDWGRGQQVDYRSHHLRHPPRGYEWREVDGNYVLGAVATGLILSTMAADH
jgi:Ni/Co efflux regulator RcnB